MRGWLLRIHEAASRRNFQGTFVVSVGGNVASARIAHSAKARPARADRIARRRLRRVYRHGDDRPHGWPRKPHGDDGAARTWSALSRRCCRPATMAWPPSMTCAPEGSERVAGHHGDRAAICARDGLALGIPAVGRSRHTICCCAPKCWASTTRCSKRRRSRRSFHRRAAAARQHRAADAAGLSTAGTCCGLTFTPTRLEAEGWSARQPVPGFEPVSCVRRQIDAPGDAGAKPAAPPVIQSIYSDGLTYVSVFIEPFRAAAPCAADGRPSIGRDARRCAQRQRRLVGDGRRRRAARRR